MVLVRGDLPNMVLVRGGLPNMVQNIKNKYESDSNLK